jgi:hypothetical protein
MPGGKDGRCVRVTTLPPTWCRKSRRSRSLNLPESQEPLQACSGKPLPLPEQVLKADCAIASRGICSMFKVHVQGDPRHGVSGDVLRSLVL